MRVLQLIDSLNAGGAEKLAVVLTNQLSKKGYQSYICTTRQEGILKAQIEDLSNYSFLERKSVLDWKAILKLYRFIKAQKITHIHVHATSFFMGTIMKLLNPKLVLIWHDHYGKSDYLEQRPIRALKRCSYFFDAIVCVNEKLLKFSLETLHCKNVFRLQNFPDIKTISSAKTILKGTYGKRIICLANFRPQKDLFNLIKAFENINKKYADWTLHLVGQQFNDAYSELVLDTISNSSASSQIYTYGSCSDIKHILSQATIGVLSSKSEGLPLALLEYGAAGLGVVATNVGDCKSVIQTNHNGLLVPPSDSKLLSEAIKKMITDSTYRISCGKSLCDKVQNDFNSEDAMSQLLKIYNLKQD